MHCITYGLPSLVLNCKIIAAYIVGSRLDYCNSFCWDLCFKRGSPTTFSKYTCSDRYRKFSFLLHHAILSNLHWLPVCHRINFKIATITFKVLYFQQPFYLVASFHGMCEHDHYGLLLPWQYVSIHENPQWQCPNHFHLLPHIFGTNCHISFHPFPLFLLSGRD